MGCKYCVLGTNCQGSSDLDDLGANCTCECHNCPDCGEPDCNGYCYEDKEDYGK